jgi:hypothetical protein
MGKGIFGTPAPTWNNALRIRVDDIPYFLAYLLSGNALKLKIGCDVQQNSSNRYNSMSFCSKIK